MELDGPYYSTLDFFDRVSKLERIVNISGSAGIDDQETGRSEGQAHISVRTERERSRVVYGDHLFQPRSDTFSGWPGS